MSTLCSTQTGNRSYNELCEKEMISRQTVGPDRFSLPPRSKVSVSTGYRYVACWNRFEIAAGILVGCDVFVAYRLTHDMTYTRYVNMHTLELIQVDPRPCHKEQ